MAELAFARLSPRAGAATATIDDIHFVATIEYEDYPDESYLHQKGFEDRLDAYRRDEFNLVGVLVRALDDFDEEIGRNSLWGIESDSARSYFGQVARELADEILRQYGG
jgi:hypothetical protein